MGLRSVQKASRTKEWWVRFFLALFGACITNAYLAYSYTMKDEKTRLTQTEFKKELVKELICNPDS
jgi:hypothetical protein